MKRKHEKNTLYLNGQKSNLIKSGSKSLTSTYTSECKYNICKSLIDIFKRFPSFIWKI